MLLSINGEKKTALILLQVGTFLEYFDLMLYIHMAVILNEIFFPKTDPYTKNLISGFAFCSVYIFRPLGAIIFGYIGDLIGRKNTVIITSMLMAVSCVVMAVLPTYNQIGILAAWGVTLCRVMQSIASQGEIIGAEIYLTEIIHPPARYLVVSLISFAASIGGVAALVLAVVLQALDLSWRIAFLMGALIALVGFSARVKLRETPEFVDLKLRIQKITQKSKNNFYRKNFNIFTRSHPLWQEKINSKTALAYFIISCGFPACFYLSYIYCGGILQNKFNYTSNQVINNNLIVAVFQSISFLCYSLFSYVINPLKILNFRVCCFIPILILAVWLLDNFISAKQVLIFQCAVIVFGVMDSPGAGLFISHFPIARRFTSLGLMYAFSRMIIYIITSFGLVFLNKWLNGFGIFLLFIIIVLGFVWSVRHFQKLEDEIPAVLRKI